MIDMVVIVDSLYVLTVICIMDMPSLLCLHLDGARACHKDGQVSFLWGYARCSVGGKNAQGVESLKYGITGSFNHSLLNCVPLLFVPLLFVPCADCRSDCVAPVPVALQGHYDDVSAGVTWSNSFCISHHRRIEHDLY